MESFIGFNGFKFDGCGCCLSDSKTEAGNSGCAGKSSVFTAREQDILHRIRESSERARELKKQISSRTFGDKSPEEADRALRELEHLREMRSQLEKERIAAAEERMRMLGHL